MRYRSTGSFGNVGPYETFQTLCNGSKVVTGSGEHLNCVGTVRETWDVVTPNFHKRMASGEIINNPFTRVIDTRNASVSGTNQGCIGPCSGTSVRCTSYSKNLLLAPPSTDVEQPFLKDKNLPFSTLSALAGTQAMANVVPPEVMGQVELMEWKKTARMLRHPLDNLNRTLDKIRRSSRFRSSGLSLGRFIAGEWLRYRYGILPLCYTIDGLIQTAANASLERKSKRLTARGFASSKIFDDSGNGTWYSNSIDQVLINWARKSDLSVRAGVLYEHTATTVSDLGLAPHELPASAYELIPYSFVFDWLVNMGDWIRAVTPKAGVTYLASWTTYRSKDHFSYNGSDTWNTTLSGVTYTGVQNWSKSRDVDTIRREPGVRVELVRKTWQGSKADLVHTADAIALIINKLR